MNATILQLREIVKNLKEPTIYDEIPKIKTSSSKHEVPTSTGSMSIEGILKENSTAIAKVEMNGDCHLTPHTHKEKEFLVVINGEMDLRIEKCIKTYKIGDCATIEPNQVHEVIKGNATLIAITVPKSEGFPNGKFEK